MIKLDLITGFLGSGKTTFLRYYAKKLIEQGEKICIIENDFGAINIDMVLLKDLEGEKCNLEMVVGGDGAEAHKRRLKTKLISMAMLGYNRVIIEPSGVYDVDEFFDLLYEEPIDNWYEAGNVITIVNPKQEKELSVESRYLFMSEAAQAGLIVISRVNMCDEEEISEIKHRLNGAMQEFGCKRKIDEKDILIKDWDSLEEIDYSRIINCGFNRYSHVKMPLGDGADYQTYFYFDFQMEIQKLIDLSKEILEDASCGNIHRIKGIIKAESGDFWELNITRNDIMTKIVSAERAVLIVIGEGLNKGKITEYLGEPSI